MLITEFEQRTGIFPTIEMYHIIEEAYMNCDMDKDAFCKAYKKNADGIAERIQKDAAMQQVKEERKASEKVKELENQITQLKDQIARLEAKVEKEEEWEPWETSQMSQERYEELAKSGQEWNDSKARFWVAETFGFNASRIMIHNVIPKYQKNRHHQIRKNGTVDRRPVYDATDWNYIRFNCAGLQYEVVNGELYQYND